MALIGMKKALAVLAALISLVIAGPALARGGGHSGGGSSSRGAYVHGYTRHDGTTVAPYWRAAPGGGSTSFVSVFKR